MLERIWKFAFLRSVKSVYLPRFDRLLDMGYDGCVDVTRTAKATADLCVLRLRANDGVGVAFQACFYFKPYNDSFQTHGGNITLLDRLSATRTMWEKSCHL
jgi:hypothetical protein